MTFKRPATDRQLTFAEISEATNLPINEVELLVMKALSVGLVKGSIDQVDQKVHMTWVQPRVLDLNQVCYVSYLGQVRALSKSQLSPNSSIEMIKQIDTNMCLFFRLVQW